MLSQMLLLFSFFASYVSPELVAFFHVICFIKTGCFNCCLFLPFKYFVLCDKKWFSTKDVSSLLLRSTKCCLTCFIFWLLFSRHVFPEKWLLFLPHKSAGAAHGRRLVKLWCQNISLRWCGKSFINQLRCVFFWLFHLLNFDYRNVYCICMNLPGWRPVE